jgi:hypothetical protein
MRIFGLGSTPHDKKQLQVSYLSALISCMQESKTTHKIFCIFQDLSDLAAHWTLGVWAHAFHGARETFSAAAKTLILTKTPGTGLGFLRSCWNFSKESKKELGAELSAGEKVIHMATFFTADAVATANWALTAFNISKLPILGPLGGICSCVHDLLEVQESVLSIFKADQSFSIREGSLSERQKVDLEEFRRHHEIKLVKNVLHIALVLLKLYVITYFSPFLLLHSIAYCVGSIAEPLYKSVTTESLEKKQAEEKKAKKADEMVEKA